MATEEVQMCWRRTSCMEAGRLVLWEETERALPRSKRGLRPGASRAKRGLWAGKNVRFHRKISWSHRVTPKRVRPNVQYRRLWSDNLGQWVKLHVTTKALRWMDKVGGLDRYVLTLPPEQIQSKQIADLHKRISEARHARLRDNPNLRAQELADERESAPPHPNPESLPWLRAGS